MKLIEAVSPLKFTLPQEIVTSGRVMLQQPHNERLIQCALYVSSRS